MKRKLGTCHVGVRFWVWLGLAMGGAVLLVGTLAWPDWIEIVFRVDPDRGSGWLEWAIVSVAFTLMVTCSAGVGRQWRGPRPASVGDGTS